MLPILKSSVNVIITVEFNMCLKGTICDNKDIFISIWNRKSRVHVQDREMDYARFSRCSRCIWSEGVEEAIDIISTENSASTHYFQYRRMVGSLRKPIDEGSLPSLLNLIWSRLSEARVGKLQMPTLSAAPF